MEESVIFSANHAKVSVKLVLLALPRRGKQQFLAPLV
jgi:hypothetical protein